MQIKLSELTFDKSIYPRSAVDWVTVVVYADAMKLGDKFPAIEVVKTKDGYSVIDGWHRCDAAKRCGFESIEATVVEAAGERERFLRAVETNLKHGRALGAYEKAQIANRLASYNWKEAKIARFLSMTQESLKRMLVKRVSPSAGLGFGKVHKAPLEHIIQAGGTVSPEAEQAEATLAVQSQTHLFVQVVSCFEGGIVNLADPDVCSLLDRMRTWLRDHAAEIRAGIKAVA